MAGFLVCMRGDHLICTFKVPTLKSDGSIIQFVYIKYIHTRSMFPAASSPFCYPGYSHSCHTIHSKSSSHPNPSPPNTPNTQPNNVYPQSISHTHTPTPLIPPHQAFSPPRPPPSFSFPPMNFLINDIRRLFCSFAITSSLGGRSAESMLKCR